MAHIRRLGPGRYQARWIDPGNHERSKVFAKKSDAEKHLVAMQHSMLSGGYVDPRDGKMTVGQQADLWLAGKVNLKPTTRALYESVLATHVRPRWNDTPLSRVDYSTIQAWVSELVAGGTSPGHVRKVTSVLSGILALAVRSKRLPSNPADGLELPRRAEQPRLYLTAAQVAELADHAARLRAGRPRRATDAAFVQYRLVVLVLSYCGLRWSELAALRVRRLDLLRGRIHVAEAITEVNGARLVWGTPKSHEARWVPVPRFLVELLTEHVVDKSADDLVFTSPDGSALRNRNARRAWFDRAADAIGVPDLTPHELRHTAASLAVSAGANVKAVQRMLGHASAALTLDRYADLFDDDLDAVAERLDVVARNSFANQTESRRNLASVSDLGRPR